MTVVLDARRRAAAARRALAKRREAEGLRMEAEALDARARAMEHTWDFEPGWDPDAPLDKPAEVE